MNNQVKSVPSARKSIHNHDNCIFKESKCIMERNELTRARSRNVRATESCSNQGCDEVDNVMSKFHRSSSPLQVKQKKFRNTERRNSLSTLNDQYTDDSDSSVLSKSLPATLASNHCSDGLHHSLPNDFDNTHWSSIGSESVNGSKGYYVSDDSLQTQHSESTTEYEREINQQSNGINKLLPTIAILILIAAIYYNNNFDLTQRIDSKNKHNYDESKFNKEMLYLGEKYKIDDQTILEVQTDSLILFILALITFAIACSFVSSCFSPNTRSIQRLNAGPNILSTVKSVSTIFEKNDTGSFIFLYDSESVNFDHMRFGDFMKDIATTAARYLRNRSDSVQPTVLHSSQLNMRSHSELMSRYRAEVARTGVLLLKDLDNVPSNLAMAFHYFCDEYNPLVAKTAIFFTLNWAECSNYSEKQSFYVDIEKCLAKKWYDVPEDNIKPLLARVVNVVIDVRAIS